LPRSNAACGLWRYQNPVSGKEQKLVVVQGPMSLNFLQP
jgi:hypothetical protein